MGCKDCDIAAQAESVCEICSQLKTANAKVERLKKFLDEWDGHESNCGRNREGFEGCNEAMFDCSCGYTEAKREALEG